MDDVMVYVISWRRSSRVHSLAQEEVGHDIMYLSSSQRFSASPRLCDFCVTIHTITVYLLALLRYMFRPHATTIR
jgi:hypothetical protein